MSPRKPRGPRFERFLQRLGYEPKPKDWPETAERLQRDFAPPQTEVEADKEEGTTDGE